MLPRGGRKVFPTYRLVGYAGLTGASTLGRLGTGPLDQRVRELERRAAPYAAGRKILPVLEVITTVIRSTRGDRDEIQILLQHAETIRRAALDHAEEPRDRNDIEERYQLLLRAAGAMLGDVAKE